MECEQELGEEKNVFCRSLESLSGNIRKLVWILQGNDEYEAFHCGIDFVDNRSILLFHPSSKP